MFTYAKCLHRSSVLLLGLCAISATLPAAAPPSFFPPVPQTVSTVPGNGDGNPYGVAFVPTSIGKNSVLQPGDLLVSNFNNGSAQQGLGSTIVLIRGGVQSVFYTSPSPAGWSGGLGVLSNGIVVAGSVPTTDGTDMTIQPGGLFFISPNGVLLQDLTDSTVDGPWGLTISQQRRDRASIYVSNVLNGTIVRYDVTLSDNPVSVVINDEVVIAKGFSHAPNAGAIVLGPAGLAYSAERDTLYIAESNDNAIYALPQASIATATLSFPPVLVSDLTNLHGPVVMVLAPNGDLLVSNSDGSNSNPAQPSEIDEYTQDGAFVTQFSVDPSTGGAFGIGVIQVGNGIAFAAVDDNTNNVTLWNTILFTGESSERGFGFGR